MEYLLWIKHEIEFENKFNQFFQLILILNMSILTVIFN